MSDRCVWMPSLNVDFVWGAHAPWDGLMTWVTLSNGTCPLFFPLEVDIFDLARPLNSRGKKGVSLRQKCRGGHAPIVAVLRGKTVTHVMSSCPLACCRRRPHRRKLSFFEFVKVSVSAH